MLPCIINIIYSPYYYFIYVIILNMEGEKLGFGWKHTTPPKNYNHKNINFAMWFTWVHVDITSQIIFVHFKYIALTLDLN
jgi:hypothetical protein